MAFPIFRPVPYIVLGSVATLLAILGPFGTGDLISFVDAFFYWLVIAAGTYSIGFFDQHRAGS